MIHAKLMALGLTHRCHILDSNGESYRLKDARRRREPGEARTAATSKLKEETIEK